MKAEIAIEKGITSKKCYLVLDDVFYVKISKKQYQLLMTFFKWRKQKDENETI